MQIEIPIVDGIVPSGSNIVQIDDELVSYKEATIIAIVDCKRGIERTEAIDHELLIIILWPRLLTEEVARLKDSSNLWGYWVLDDNSGYATSALRALYSIVKSIDDHGHLVCVGHSGVTTLCNFAPRTCNVMAFYYYSFLREGYLRSFNSCATQWILTDARARVPGIPFIGIYQGFWEVEDNAKLTNMSDPLTPHQLREQIEDFVREEACGFITYSMIGTTGPFRGWKTIESLRKELVDIGKRIRSTTVMSVPPELESMAQTRIQL